MQHDDLNEFALRLTDLANALAGGDLTALGALFDLAGPRLQRYAQALTRNRDDAEDALQAAMVRVAQHPRKLAAARMPWAYFLRIVRNESLQILQRQRPAVSLSTVFDLGRSDPQTSEREEFAALVRSAIHQLPAEQAEVVILKQWEEMTFAEVAEVIGESPNTIASRYRYALEKLSRSLETLVEVSHD